MSKKNKWTIVPFIGVSVLIITLVYLLFVLKPSSPAEPLKAVPVSASLIIKVNNYKALHESLTSNNVIWKEFRTIPFFNRLNNQLHFIDSISGRVSEINEILDNAPCFLSAHFTGKDRISFLYVFQLPQRLQIKKITELINGLVINSGTIRIRNYEGVDLHEVNLLDQSAISNFTFAFYENIMLMSFSTTVIEDAIRQLTSGESLITDSDFNKVYATAGKNVDANIFINFELFPKSLSTFVKPEFKSEVRSFKNFAGWAEMDLNLLSDMLLMNGFVNCPDSVPSIASLYVNQSPQRISPDEVLPASVSSFLTSSFSDEEKYNIDFQSFLRDQGKFNAYINTLQSINNAYGTDFPADIFKITDHEITLAFGSGSGDSTEVNRYFLIKIKSRTQAEEKFNDILTKIAFVESKPVSIYSTAFKFDNDLTFNIYHLPIHNITSKIFGEVFNVLDEHYFTILDHYVVFSGSVDALKDLIRDYVLNRTLQNNTAYKEFKNNLSPKSNLCFYCNLSKGYAHYSTYLSDKIKATWLNNMNVFRNTQIFGFQLYSNNGMLYSNLVVKYLSGVNASAQTVWESKLDTIADFKPVFVINHQTGQSEVFVQDLNNAVYLINQVGRILWKIQLPDRINSEVYQIDYYRNGKLQLLFSTKNEIYLIDRKGNYVEKFPVKLRSPSTCGVAVFDYDRNKDYRLFIPCNDHHIYAYNREGNLLQGWEFDKTEGEVTQPINHFRIGDKDFIVFGDDYKTYILDRKGNTRIHTDTYFTRSVNNNYYLDLPVSGKGPSVVTTDTAGKVFFIGFNGNEEVVECQSSFSPVHFFDYKDLTGDGKPEFIFLDNNRLTVFGNDQTKLFQYKFDEDITSRPLVYQFSSTDYKIGLVSKEDNHIYLINRDGQLYKGFPLFGNTPFSIGNFGDSLSKFNLVVGSKDNFLYNYRVR